MKLVVIAGSALVASVLGACAANSRNTAEPDRAAQQAEADKAAAQEAARKAQNDAAREQAEAQEAKRAQHTAEQQAQWASERAALAEAQAAHEAKTPAGSTRVAGTTERQADTTRAAEPARQADTTAAVPSKMEVLFNVSSTELSADAKAKLDQLAQSLKVQPESHDVMVQGFTDDAGPESTNVQLSEKRAEAVVEYLTSRGVPRDRVAAKSLGSQHPVNHDGTDRGRALNRRVEIVIRPIAKR